MPPMPDSKCKLLMNKDRPGFDLSSAKGPLNSCQTVCEATTSCRTWAWSDYEGGTCWLKSRVGDVVDKTGVWTTHCKTDEPSLVCKPLKDVDFEGNDIASMPSKDVGKCCGICNAYPGCKAYAWSDFNGGTCWLKAGAGKAVRKSGVISSSIVPLNGAVCPFEYGIDFAGNDIGNKPAKDAGECCSLCKGNADCKAYTWTNHNGGTCWMKSGESTVAQKSGAVSAFLI